MLGMLCVFQSQRLYRDNSHHVEFVSLSLSLTQNRPRFCLHMFGSVGSGKTTFREQWLTSSHAEPLGEIVNVDLSIEV